MTIGAATRVFAVIGNPVSHSLSPLMHNGWIADHRMDAVYVALPLRSDDPVAAIRALGQLGFSGANVTTPYKEAAARAADAVDDVVANTLRWEANGALTAFNTDGAGFVAALAQTAPDWLARVRRVLIVGAGGAAIAIGKALSPAVEAVDFVNRTQARAVAAAAMLGNGGALGWQDMERGFGAADLIVQATSLGLNGSPAPDWPVAHCQNSAIVADIVYRPLETVLLRKARARGLVAIDGLGMLIHQGARAFEWWFGVRPDIGEAHARLMSALQR
ncbi:MAG: shikimate dehydrogenase [Terricaulis sp.]